MASFILGLPFQPVLTGPLLWALTRGSPDLKERLIAPLANLPFTVDQGLLVTSLKWLFALGVVSKVNGLLNSWALNKWSLSANSGAKWDLPKETLVITGGSGGIATEIVKNVAVTGMKIAIMDVQAPPAGLKEREYNNSSEKLQRRTDNHEKSATSTSTSATSPTPRLSTMSPSRSRPSSAPRPSCSTTPALAAPPTSPT